MRSAGTAVALAAAVALVATGCGAERERVTDEAASTPSSSASSSEPSSEPSSEQPNEPAPAALRAGEQFVTLQLPGGAYRPEPAPGSLEDYRCFLLDPELDADSYLTGSGFLADNKLVVHHAIVYRVDPERVAAAQRKDDADSDPGWSCFGGPGVESAGDPIAALDDAAWLSAWAPGGGEATFREGTGMPIEAGSKVVLQVHYHVERGFAGVDRSQVRLRVADASTPLTPLRTTLLPAPVELPCPDGQTDRLCSRTNAVLDVISRFGTQAGATVAGLQLLCGGSLLNPVPGPTQSCDRRFNEPMLVQAAAGHMHLRGRSIRIEVNPGQPDAKVLLDVPVYDFDNQGTQPLPEPVLVDPDDTVRVTCTHDNGLSELIPELQSQEPRYVVWGEGTTDEMCLGIIISTPA
jgi:hypothetical protein